MAYKVFSNGNTLPASDLNTYLMNQSVMTFASSTARSAALTAPTEGMLTWLEDSNKYQKYDGAAWVDLISDSVYTQAGKNAIINGAFDIWQRGTSFSYSASGDYGADRFKFDAGALGSLTVTRQTFSPGQTDVPGEPTYYAQIAYSTDSANTPIIEQRIENVGTFAGQTVTLSFYAKVNSGTKAVSPRYVQSFGSGGSSTVVNTGSSLTLTTSWQRFSQTYTIPSISGKTVGSGSYLRIDLLAGQTSSLTYSVANIQLEAGSVATPFSRNASSIQGELAACQRYYVRYNAASNVYAGLAPSGFIQSSTVAMTHVQFPVEMRISPTAIDYSTVQIIDANTSTFTPSALTISGWATAKLGGIEAAISGGTAGRFALLRANNSTSAYVGFSAEL